ncbi:protein asteroid [Cimex lectularius]|uniref:Protein asteroid n=1 Tax=Cimex lectularius TaxID=79782 RepID=A0A8I6RNR7_CIMLE|nr:protein asteroid [Cimex lectularius]
MGVSGLTSFLYRKEDVYFKKFYLKNTPLVIDGNSLAAYVSTHIGGYMTFGGDYDRLGARLEYIFTMLASCGIVPIVIFDGSAEKKKYKTIIARFVGRVLGLYNVSPGYYCAQFFPIMLRAAVRNKLRSLGVTVLQSDFEADREIAAVADKLNAPVLSNDSDFFIFNVLYIPLGMIEFKVEKAGMPCLIFSVENLLCRYDGLEKDVLPLLSVVAGNDYCSGSVFLNFLGKLSKCSNSSFSRSYKTIHSVLYWLKTESYDSAFEKIVSSFPAKQRKTIKKLIKNIVKGYTDLETSLVDYIPEEKLNNIKNAEKDITLSEGIAALTISEESTESDIENDDEIESNVIHCQDDDAEECTFSLNVESDECTFGLKNDSEDDSENEVKTEQLPSWVLERSRVGQFDAVCLTLYNLKSFFMNPQIEEYNMEYAGIVALPVIQYLAGVVLGETEFSLWSRANTNKYEATSVKTSQFSVNVTLENIPKINGSLRKQLLMQALNIEDGRLSKECPEEWVIYLFSVIFWAKSPSSSAKPYHVYSLIMVLIAITTMDHKIGYYRKKNYLQRNKNKIMLLKSNCKKNVKTEVTNPSVKKAHSKVSKDECLLMTESLTPYFMIDRTLRCRKVSSTKFSKAIVHAFSEFQACLQSVMLLNEVLGMAYAPTDITKIYNGTFLYNMTVKLMSKSCYTFLRSFFEQKGASSLAKLFVSLCEILKDYLPEIMTSECSKVKKRKANKSKKKVTTVSVESTIDLVEDTNDFVDPNNKFNLLSCL